VLAVIKAAPGVVELNYMWLPTWIGLNSALLQEIGDHLRAHAIGRELDEHTLLDLHY
jgi:hypothetical protein